MGKFLELPANIWENDSFKKVIKNLIYFLFIGYFVIMFSIIANDNRALNDKKNALYIVSILVPMVLFAYAIFSNMEDKKYLVIVIIMVLLIVFMLLRTMLPSFDTFLKDLVYSLTSYTELPPLSSEGSYLVSISLKFILIMIGIVFLSILSNVAFNEAFRQRGRVGIFLYALFYIPCLVTDYVKYLFHEVTTTPRVVYTLIAIEAALIGLYFFIPWVLSKIWYKQSERVLKDPIFLSMKRQIADAKPFYNRSATHKELEAQYNLRNSSDNDTSTYIPNKSLIRNYAISLWATVNPPSLGEKEECMIFRVGRDFATRSDPDNPTYGSPYISCTANKWKFVYSNNVLDQNGTIDTKEVSAEYELPYQRWNYIVFNYHDNQVDLFINGVLRDTRSLGKHMPQLYYDQVITTGSDTKQIHGAICEVRVHQENLGQNDISQSYNLLKLKNPPVNNLS